MGDGNSSFIPYLNETVVASNHVKNKLTIVNGGLGDKWFNALSSSGPSNGSGIDNRIRIDDAFNGAFDVIR
jgi:hypothetical protein